MYLHINVFILLLVLNNQAKIELIGDYRPQSQRHYHHRPLV
jgi:hypothetical protein